jgi:hypothetical protein
MSVRGTNRAAIAVAIALWLGGVLFGFRQLLVYASTPGESAAVAESWPGASRLPRDASHATIVLFAHPRCPCTRASLNELARLLTVLEGRLDAVVVFTKPEGASEDWDRTDLCARAREIRGVTVRLDEGCVEAARFHAHTSGQCFVYDAEGRLLFEGGITAGRGHEGDNVGSQRIVSILEKRAVDRRDSPVYGCRLGP